MLTQEEIEELKQKDYEKCFVYQCLSSVCHGADIESDKFLNMCLDCPAFLNWLEKRMINRQ